MGGCGMKKSAVAAALAVIGVGAFMVSCSAHVHYAVKIAVCAVGAVAAYKIASPYAVDSGKGDSGIPARGGKGGRKLSKIKKIAAVALVALGVAEITVLLLAVNHRINYGAWDFFCIIGNHVHGDRVSSTPSFDAEIDFGTLTEERGNGNDRN
jgi:hypothetical protein